MEFIFNGSVAAFLPRFAFVILCLCPVLTLKLTNRAPVCPGEPWQHQLMIEINSVYSFRFKDFCIVLENANKSRRKDRMSCPARIQDGANASRKVSAFRSRFFACG